MLETVLMLLQTISNVKLDKEVKLQTPVKLEIINEVEDKEFLELIRFINNLD